MSQNTAAAVPFIAPLKNVEWRMAGNGQDYTFTGTAAVFDHWSDLLWTPRGEFRERIRPGAFSDVLARKPDVRLLFNHDKNLVLARTKSGTLELSEEEDALRVWARVAPTSYAQDLRIVMEREDVDQMSFSFEFEEKRGAEDHWYRDKETGENRRDVLKVSDLFDVSPVTFPAYVETEAAMRSLDRAVASGRFEIAPRHKNDRQRRYTRTLQLAGETPWAILPESLQTILEVLNLRANGEKFTAEEIRERIGTRDDRPVAETNAGVAVLGLYGPVFPRANMMTELSGATSLETFQDAFQAAVNDPAVTSILLDIDSPGGLVSMVPEVAAEIRAARKTKPVVAVANTLAASAAYWIGSAASELVASPSAKVGSIGVYAAHEDISGMEEKLGVKTTLVSAGKYKTEGNPFEPLTDEAKQAIQSDVDEFYKMFTSAVAQGRGVSVEDVRNGFGEGRLVTAKKALALGMVDRVETFDETIARLNAANPVQERSEPDLAELPTTVFESRAALADALGLTTTAAQAERDPAGIAFSRERQLTDGTEASDAQAERDPAAGQPDALEELRAASVAAMQEAREEKVRLTKEMLK